MHLESSSLCIFPFQFSFAYLRASNCQICFNPTFLQLQRKLLDVSLGFAAGVMIAASYWSLLSPAIEMASQSGSYGELAFIPVAAGFFLGCLFVYMVDVFLSDYHLCSTSLHSGEYFSQLNDH